ncbi:MAG: hypothetical protein JWL84_1091 [Rhodospirillales bacterium]|nr:hypothetical protein [Rhodospirillales bacterium]
MDRTLPPAALPAVATPIVSRGRLASCGVFVAIGIVVASGSAAAHIDLRTDRLGNVFAPGEKVAVSIATDLSEIRWTATDFFHARVDGGTLAVAGGKAEIDMKPGVAGWFELDVAAPDGGEAAKTTLAVLPVPATVSTSGRYGVMTHFAQGWETDILPLVARAGIGQVRDELYWDHIETAPGKLAVPDRYRAYLEALDRAHLKLQLVLSFANPLYDGGQTPYSDTAIAAFAAYSGFLAKTLGPRLSGVEVWNEFNGSFCKGPCEKDRAAAYAAILHASNAAIKTARPGLAVGGGAAILAPLPWFQGLFDHGALDDMDAVVVHPYRTMPAGTEIWLQQLGALEKKYAHGRAVPIWATEFSHQYRGPDGPRDAARYLVADAAIMLGEGVPRISWYLLRDYQHFDGMGLVAAPDNPLGRYAVAPAYVAYGVLTRQLGDAAPHGREASDPRTRVYRFDDHGEEIRVAWSPGGATRVVLDATGPLRLADMMGNERELRPQNGRAEIGLGADPVYLRGRVTAIHEPDRRPLLADSLLDFGDDGRPADGWSYGAYLCPPAAADALESCLASFAAAALEPLVWQADAWHWSWRSSRFRSFEISADGGHPSVSGGRPVWAVRRWIASRNGKIRISGVAERPAEKGDGTIVMILQDGKPLWRTALGGHGATDRRAFSLTADVRPGTKLDFVTTPGEAVDMNADFTLYGIEIAAAS